MKSRESIKKQMCAIQETERRTLEALVEDINTVVEKGTITEDTIHKLNNVENVISSLKDNYMWRLLKAAKQNHMID